MPYDIIVGRTESDKELFGDKALVYLGKTYVNMGNTSSLSNRIFMDVARSHVVLICGKRGSGKCLTGDTLIPLSDGSFVPIAELENNKEKVLSLNEILKIEEAEKIEFFKREVDRIFKIRLRSGKEIKLTPEHPLLTIKGWKEAQDLKIGSRIATPRKIPCFGDKEMSEHEIKLLAYLIAEGHTKSIVLFSNSDEKIVKDFRESLKKLDSSLYLIKENENHYRISSPDWKSEVTNKEGIIRNEKGQFSKGQKLIHKKRSIREIIEREEIFGLLSTKKYLSKNIIQLKIKNLSLFLNRLFSCDGSIYKTNDYWEISYSSSSEKLIRQVQSLLLRFGILSKLRNKKIKNHGKMFNSFELILNSENVLKFIENIGFFGKKYEKQLIAKLEISSKIRNPNIDTIPREVWEMYRPKNWAKIGRALGYKYPKSMRERVRYAPSRQTLLSLAEVENSNPLRMLATSDIFWDEIVYMEVIEEKTVVYDLSVPNLHNFVANDIIVHNSYTLGVLAEEMSTLPKEVSENIGTLIFDTMGIYWTMTHENEKEKELLRSWDLEPKKIPIKIFVPFGYSEKWREKGIENDSFSLKISEMSADDWIITFGINFLDDIAIAIQRNINGLKEKGEEYDIDDIIKEIEKDYKIERNIKNAAVNLFEGAKTWGLFAGTKQEGTKVRELVEGGRTSVLDLSCYNSTSTFNVRALVIGLLSKKLFNERMASRKYEETQAVKHGLDYLYYKEKRDMPLVWLMIDEAHEFLQKEGKTAATDALIQLLREGRQPGISLILATQQPGEMHKEVLTQSDIVISHRVTAKPDIDALNYIMQSYLTKNIQNYLNDLPKVRGTAIVLDDNSERIYPIRIHGRLTWHGGEAPTSIKIKERV